VMAAVVICSVLIGIGIIYFIYLIFYLYNLIKDGDNTPVLNAI